MIEEAAKEWILKQYGTPSGWGKVQATESDFRWTLEEAFIAGAEFSRNKLIDDLL